MSSGRARTVSETEQAWDSPMRPLTLKAALYGIPIGRLARTANSRFANGALKARLCEISWIARKRFWFAVAPTV